MSLAEFIVRARHVTAGRLPRLVPVWRDVLLDAVFVFTDALVIFDNLRSQARVVASARVSSGATDADLGRAHDDALRTIDATIARLRGPAVLAPLTLDPKAPAADGTSVYDKE